MGAEQAAGIEVAVEGYAITVTRRGTSFKLVYEWQPETRQLVEMYSWIDDHVSNPTIAEFRNAAWRAACTRAIELGWTD